MSNSSPSLYEVFKCNRTEILTLAEQQLSIVTELHIDAIQTEGTKPGQVLNGLIERLKADSFQVLVIGCFSAGKSTFINAMIGTKLLPATRTPTTGVICEITYAEESAKKATLYPKEGMGENGSSAPFPISVHKLRDELEKYVKIDHNGEETATSRYKKLALQWPLSLCENGVTIIDSVGLNDPDSRHEITLDYAQSADAVLYLMTSGATYSATDAEAIRYLRSLGYESPFFIITSYDSIRESAAMGEQSEEEFQQIIHKALTPLTDLGAKGIKFVDSRAALNGRISGDANLVAESRIVEVENALEQFLVQEKGQAKLLTTLRSLRRVNKMARQLIPTRIALKQTSAKDLEKRFEEAQIPLKNLETRRKLLVDKVHYTITGIARDAYDMADAYFAELPAKVKKWTNDYQIEGAVGFPPTKKKIEPIVTEVVKQIKGKIESDVADWNQQYLNPLITERFMKMEAELEAEASAFLRSVEELRVQIVVGESISEEEIARKNEPSALSRLAGVGWTLLTGDFVSGGMGMVMGFRAMLNTIVCQIVAAIILIMFNLLNPVAILVAVVASVMAGGFMNILSLKNGIKNKVGATLSEELTKNQKTLAKNVEQSVTQVLHKRQEAIDSGLKAEISRVRDEVTAELATKRSGKVDTEAEIAMLERVQQLNVEIDDRLDHLSEQAGLPA